MSFLSEQKTELKTAQVTEALLRMKKLSLHENVINEFKNEGKLNSSDFGGILYWLEEEWKTLVEKFENETGNLVYHVIHNRTEFGELLTFLYVSKDADEWILDDQLLEENLAMAYVKNLDDDICSEFGSVMIQKRFGGVVRIA